MPFWYSLLPSSSTAYHNLLCSSAAVNSTTGEEAKKPEEKKMEDKKPHEDGKQEKKAEDDKKEDNKKKKAEESKKDTEAPPPPPPPQEIVLKVYMHCEGCARKVRRSLKGFDGVEEVMTDCRTNKVVVKGEKADPLKVLERVQRKSHGQVELLSPIPKPLPPPPSPAKEEKKPETAEQSNPPEKKEEPKVVTVVLKVLMHCDACAQEMKKRILRMKGVKSADPDLKGSQVSVKGVFEPANLVEYVHKRTGRHAVIVKQEPEEKKEEEAGKDGGDKGEKKGDDAGGNKKDDESGGGNKKDDGDKDKKGGGDGVGKPETASVEEEIDNLGLELKKNENLYYPPYYLPRFVPLELYGNGQPYRHPYQYQYQYQQPADAYAPQIFSDENPNACSVM